MGSAAARLHPQHQALLIPLAKIPAGIGGSGQISRKTSHPYLNHPEFFLAAGNFPSRYCYAHPSFLLLSLQRLGKG